MSTATDEPDLQPAARGTTAPVNAAADPGLPAEADNRAIASSLHVPLIYAQDMCILRRKDLENNCKDYSIVGTLVVHSIQESVFQVWQ